MIEELKPCPFCGHGQSIVDPWFDDVSKRWAIGCGRCGASSGRSVHAKGSKEAAIRSWNTRPSHEAGTQAYCYAHQGPVQLENGKCPLCSPAGKQEPVADKEIGKQIGAYLGMSGIDAEDVAHIRKLVTAPASQDATREALEPFAEVAKHISPQCPDDYSLMQLHNLTAGHFRKAAAALASPARADRAVTADEGAGS